MARGRLELTLGLDGGDGGDEGPGAPDDVVEDLLEDQGRRRVLEGDVDDLVPCADELLAMHLGGRPNAELLVGRVLHRCLRSRDRAWGLATSAQQAFAEAGDTEGVCAAEILLGDLAWQGGDVVAADSHWTLAMGHGATGAAVAGLLTLRVAADFLNLGDLERAMPRVHEAYAATVIHGRAVDEAMATLLRGLLSIDTGDLAEAGDAFERADDLFTEVTVERDTAMWPLVKVGLGEIAARRGDPQRARLLFDQALAMAERVGNPQIAIVARAMVPLHLSSVDPGLALEMASSTVALAEEADGHWFARQLADRALAEAYLSNGEHELAAGQAASCIARARNPLLRAKCLMIAGRVDLGRGRPADAARAFDDAATTFLSRGTYLWGVEALLALAATDAGRASEYLGLAYDRTGADPAFERLWSHRPRFTITLGPGDAGRFNLGGDDLRLGDKGEHLMVEIVRRGNAGLHWENAAAALWPEDVNLERMKSRLTSLTSLVRGRLRSEGWRLRRDGPLFLFVAFASEVSSEA